MSDDSQEKIASTPLPSDKPQDLRNRKQRRMEAAVLKRANRVYRDYYYWHRRIINEMKENAIIQRKIVDGTFDKFLEVTTEESSDS